jgi:hypothetical protein
MLRKTTKRNGNPTPQNTGMFLQVAICFAHGSSFLQRKYSNYAAPFFLLLPLDPMVLPFYMMDHVFGFSSLKVYGAIFWWCGAYVV